MLIVLRGGTPHLQGFSHLHYRALLSMWAVWRYTLDFETLISVTLQLLETLSR